MEGCGPPPPDAILVIPPPPLPDFLRVSFNDSSDLCFTDLCSAPPPGLHFSEIPPPKVDDTWLLVLVSSSVGVLLLGALFAILLLKCKQEGRVKDEMEERGKVEAVLYPGRVEAWASLGPRGQTTHSFCCPNNNDPFYPEPPPLPLHASKPPPTVSTPTHIENHNLPPLNLFRYNH